MHKKVYFWVALFWTLLVSYLCLTPSSTLPAISFLFLDKGVHFFFHFIFTVQWILAFKDKIQTTKNKSPFLIYFLSSAVFGVTIEIFQGLFTATRSADVLDIFANMMGAGIAVFLMKTLWNSQANKI